MGKREWGGDSNGVRSDPGVSNEILLISLHRQDMASIISHCLLVASYQCKRG